MKIIKLLSSFLLLLLLTGCPPCNPVYVNNGSLPENALTLVPYRNGEIYKFRHSRGHVIRFSCSRYDQTARTSCGECCDKVITYDVNTTWLVPDIPIFSIQIDISNIDTSYFYCIANLGTSFHIPSSPADTTITGRTDSLLLNNTWYYDVFSLKSYAGDFVDPGEIYADSLFYNYEKGILMIKMSNDESYTICED